jgi:hypothetical protein
VILPTKGIPPRQAVLTVGADILRLLGETKTVSRAWDDFQRQSEPGSEVTFDWFVLGLDLLFSLGAVEFDRGRLRRTELPGDR